MKINYPLFFVRILIVVLSVSFFMQSPVNAHPVTATDLADHIVYLPMVVKNYVDQSSGFGNVSGYVKDARTDTVLAGAEVCYQDTICDTTGEDGRFTLNNIPTGGKTFTAAAIGYAKGTEYAEVEVDKL